MKVEYPIFMNGKPAYAMRCPKCGSEYSMYVYKFKQNYIGIKTPGGGFIGPTHGTKSIFQTMDRKAKEEWEAIPHRTEKHLCDELHLMTHEEYKEMQKKRQEEEKKAKIAHERHMQEVRGRIEEEERRNASSERQDLIRRGILKYVKGIGLVNTETGQVVKL